MAGAMTISALCISWMVAAPQTPIAVRRAPTRFCRAVGDRGGAEEYLLQRGVRAHLDARAAGQGGVGMGHAPVIAASGGFLGLGEDRAKHHGIGAGGEGLADIAALAETAVGDYGHISAGLAEVLIPGRRAVDSGGYLGHADARALPGKCRRRRGRRRPARRRCPSASAPGRRYS